MADRAAAATPPRSVEPARATTAAFAPLPKAQRNLTLAAVMVVLLLSALDQTIVATAMPRIIADLSGLERYAWVGAAYLLTGTVGVPIWGKLGDIHGRRSVLIAGVLIFLAGSALCGLAGEFGPLPLIGDGMNQLILFRAIQGIGGGALATGAFGTIADLFPPAERGRYAGLFGAVFGLAGVAGPLVGGALTDHATTTLFGHQIAGWRFVFYVNLPLGALALFVLVAKMPRRAGLDPGVVDWIGGMLVLAAFVPLLLALSLGGHGLPWDSPITIALFAAAIVMLAALLRQQGRADNPILPLPLFRDPVFARANLALFLSAMAFMGLVMFFPLWMQVVRGVSATHAGLAMLPLTGALLASSIVSGRVSSAIRGYKPILVAGGALLLAGIASLTTIGPETSFGGVVWRMILVGLGLGPGQGMFTLAIQNAVEPRRIGQATASAQFGRQIGSTVGVALFGALFTNRLVAELPARAPALGAQPDLARAQAMAMQPAGLDPATAGGLIAAFDHSIVALFWVALGIAAATFAVTLAVPARELRGRDAAPAGG